MASATLFIQGMFHNDKGWAKWESYFNENGYKRLTQEEFKHGNDPSNVPGDVKAELMSSEIKHFPGRTHESSERSGYVDNDSKWVFLQGRQPDDQSNF